MSQKCVSTVAGTPRHVAIIMDGNRRWARRRGREALTGHQAGFERLRELLATCRDQGIEVLSLYVFSTENAQRPAQEVEGLMAMFQRRLEEETGLLVENRIRLHLIGDRSRLGESLRHQVEAVERRTSAFGDRHLVVAVHYSGRWDILQMVRRIAGQAAAGALDPAVLTEADVARHMELAGLPPPDLCIRTGGECRLSNFMLWQLAYSELYFTDCHWPDFDEQAFLAALRSYATRQRRFGRRLED